MTNPVWSYVLGLNAWALKKAHIMSWQPQPRLQISTCKANSSQTELSPPKPFTLFIHFTESLRRSNFYIFYLWILKEHNY